MPVLGGPTRSGLDGLGGHQQVAGLDLGIELVDALDRRSSKLITARRPRCATGWSRTASTTASAAARALISITRPSVVRQPVEHLARASARVRSLPAKGSPESPSRANVGAGIGLADLVHGHGRDRAGAIGRAVERLVVDDRQLAVGGEVDVELDRVGPGLDAQAEGLHRVLRRLRARHHGAPTTIVIGSIPPASASAARAPRSPARPPARRAGSRSRPAAGRRARRSRPGRRRDPSVSSRVATIVPYTIGPTTALNFPTRPYRPNISPMRSGGVSRRSMSRSTTPTPPSPAPSSAPAMRNGTVERKSVMIARPTRPRRQHGEQRAARPPPVRQEAPAEARDAPRRRSGSAAPGAPVPR